MRVRLERLLGEIWKGHRSVALHPLARLLYWLLIPFATMYASLLWGRREGYRLGFLRRRRVSAAVVVSIGNITVGGTGKTPLVVGLARGLMERDVGVAVVTRGYGATGRGAGPLLVSDGSGPLVGADRAGDEAVMVASALPVVVIVSRDRYKGTRLAAERYGAQVVILDDGFQHLALERDADILLLDPISPFGNRWTLPAGPMREPLSALRDVDLFMFVHRGIQGVRPIPDRLKGLLRAHSPHAVILDGVLQLSGMRPAGTSLPHPVEWLKGRRILLVSGVAVPEAFEAEVRQRGGEVVGHLDFADHHPYRREDVEEILSVAAELEAEAVVTTAKDEVKLLPAGFDTGALPLWIAEAGYNPRTIELLVTALHQAV